MAIKLGPIDISDDQISLQVYHTFFLKLQIDTIIPLSDLIHGITENGLRHASGPVHAQHPICYTNTCIEPIK